jgi:hypothetical protein
MRDVTVWVTNFNGSIVEISLTIKAQTPLGLHSCLL